MQSADLIVSDGTSMNLLSRKSTRSSNSKTQIFTVQASSSDTLNLIKLKIFECAPVDHAYPACQV